MSSSSNSWRNIASPRPQSIPTAKTLLTEFIIPKDVEQWSINWYSYFRKQLAYLVMLKTPIVSEFSSVYASEQVVFNEVMIKKIIALVFK